MAIKETRKSVHRTKLGTVIPLKTPFVLFVDPNSACNFQCTFCPTGDRPLMKAIGRYQGNLSIEDFEKIVSDCGDFNEKIKVLRLYKDGEPLMNKNIYSMVSQAKKSGFFESVDTTTNGFLLRTENSEKLVEAGLDLINISVDGLSAEQFFHFTKQKVDFDVFVDQIKYLHQIRGEMKIVIKTTSEIVGSENHDLFYEIFEPYCDKIFIENTSPCWPDFDVEERMGIEITKGLYGNAIVDQTACPYLFYSMSINSDMKASACFVDWSRDLIVGDVREKSVKSIWNSELLNSHRLNHLLGRRKQHSVCGNCGQISHCGPDSIEDDISIIRNKFQEYSGFKEENLIDCGYNV